MKKVLLVALAVTVVFSAVGCFGPRHLSRGLDDWANQQYVNQPWLIGNVISAGLLGIAFWVTGAIDGLVDIYYFWGKDAWPFGANKGTPFNHTNPTMPAGK